MAKKYSPLRLSLWLGVAEADHLYIDYARLYEPAHCLDLIKSVLWPISKAPTK